MKCKVLYSILLGMVFFSSTFAIENNAFNKHDPACISGKPETSSHYMATKWYLDSPASAAIYTEVFAMGLNHIQNRVKDMKSNDKPWGVVFDIDETILNNMQYTKTYEVLQCQDFSWKSWRNFMQQESSTATPGAVNITCAIQKIGGKVVLVTNRPQYLEANTLVNLNKVGICYDSLVFAKDEKENDKNSRFNAIKTGQYDSFLVSNKKLPALNVIAYFGDNIQDFPDIKQKNVITESANSTFFKQFGTKYFSLSNPIYGSWMKNSGFNEESTNELEKPLTSCTKGIAKSSNLYWAAQWYLYSAEVRAQYNEIFNNAYLTIQNKIAMQKLKPGSWGTVFAIDGTLLNNPNYLRNKAVLECKGINHTDDWYNYLNTNVATPGALDITCNIRKLGGHVVLVTNRNMNPNKDVLRATIENLHKNGICFDKVLLASKPQQEKSSRFAQVATKMDIVAYFGSEIADFPEDAKANSYNKFGQDYFMLPNPVYGNWSSSSKF